LELVFHPDYSIFDGRNFENSWLQELPDPITKLTWDNAAVMGISTAKKLKLRDSDLVELKCNNNTVTAPVWIVPGYADGCIGLALGYGRQSTGFDTPGVNAYSLRASSAMGFATVQVNKTGKTYPLASTQIHKVMEGRNLVRNASKEHFIKNPEFALEPDSHNPPNKSLFTDRQYGLQPQWGMVIDLNSCIGCGACTVACQSENNIPSVGKKNVKDGREMHWLRIDRYYSSDKKDDDVGMLHQPVPCMQCETAPCEQVCPVTATAHSKDGLNDMVYNRCIGTRYCSNNCPFKVRRFNYFNFHEEFKKPENEVKKMIHNPNVTVRFRGVMEKCTYCIQRINEAKIKAKLKGQKLIPTDSFTSACAQVCPTKAIKFGDILDKKSDVKRAKEQSRNYDLLAHLNLRPRTSYLAKITHPNPKLNQMPEIEEHKKH